MKSKKELEDILFYEDKSLSRNDLYQVYLYLNSIKELRENFELEKNIVWYPHKIKKNSQFLKKYLIKLPIPLEQLGLLFPKGKDFWTITNLINLINIKEIKEKYLNKDKCTLEHYIYILLNHMIPINHKYIKIYIEKINKKIQQKKNNSDKEGIYEDEKKQQVYRDISTKIEGEDFMTGIPPKIEIEMNGKKLPSIQKINRYELDSFMKRDDIVRGELFIDEDTGDLYVVDKGDLETYWLRMGRIEKEKEKEEEKLEAFKNPFLN